MSDSANKRQKGPNGSPVGPPTSSRNTRTPPTSRPTNTNSQEPSRSSARNVMVGSGNRQDSTSHNPQDAQSPSPITSAQISFYQILLRFLPIMPPTRSTRSTRAGTSRLTAPTSTSASINRQASDPHHLRITVKAPPSKLRQAISGDDPESDYPDVDDSPEPPVRTARSTRNPRTVLDNESDEEQEDDDDDDDDDEDEDEDAEGEHDDVENTEMMDAEGSDEDADADADDMDMDSPHPTAPVIRVLPAVSTTNSKPKASIAVSAPPHKGNLKSVEAKELDDDDEDDDDELSDLQSGDEDLPGVEDDDEELDSDLEGEDGDVTLDLTKLTRRQRAVYDEEQDESLMALSNEAQKKKHLTAEEHAMRRAEMARRRKNLSEKRNEEEKMDTINKLLKKPAPKRRTRAEIIAAQNAAEATPAYTEDGEEYFHPASSLFVRYVNNKDGSRIGVPSEWLEEDQPVGQVLRNGWKPPSKMVEEVS